MVSARPEPTKPASDLYTYIASMVSAYFSFTTLRLIFIVGVISPPSIENSAGRMVIFLIACTRASDLLISSICWNT